MQHDRVGQGRAGSRLQRTVTRRSAIAGARAIAGKMLARERLVHQPIDRFAVPGQRYQRPPHRQATDKGLGAVDRVEDPDVFGVRMLGGEFFADDAVSREGLLDERAHHRFGGPVGGCHRIEAAAMGLVLDATSHCGRTAGSSRPRRSPVHRRRLQNRSRSSRNRVADCFRRRNRPPRCLRCGPHDTPLLEFVITRSAARGPATFAGGPLFGRKLLVSQRYLFC